NHLQHHVDVQIFHAADAAEGFVDRDSSDRNRRFSYDCLTYARNVAAGGEVHQRVSAIFDGVVELGDLFVDVRRSGGVADIGIDLATRGDANAHRLQVGVMDVGRDNHPATRHFGTNQLAGNVL